MAHFNAKWYYGKLELEIAQINRISDDYSKVSTALMRELINKYADIFTKPSKPFSYDIKHKVELLDPEKSIPHHILLRMSEKRSTKAPERIPTERLETAHYILVQSPHFVYTQ